MDHPPMIEKLARAMLRERHPCWSIVGEIFDPTSPQYNLDGQADEMRSFATAILAALMEATTGMVKAGSPFSCAQGDVFKALNVMAVWQAMIQHALQEGV